MTMVMIPIVIIMTISLTELSQQTAKKCHRSCVFAAACTVSLSSFLGFALREVISVHLGILSQTLELRMGGATCRNTPAALHCLWDTSQGIRVGEECANEETPS